MSMAATLLAQKQQLMERLPVRMSAMRSSGCSRRSTLD
jgi:hypothetical protein